MTEEITDDKIKEMFELFDADGGGTIDVPELTAALVNLGISDTKEEIDKLVQQIDTDGSGEIEYEEFREVMVQLLSQRDSVAEIYKAFDFFSGGKDRITLSDLRKVSLDIDIGGPAPTELYLQEMLVLADTDRDGVVTFHDFKAMMEQAIATEKSELNDPKKILMAANAADGVQY
jgi:centrin-1